jgi:alpha-ketoglutarate-dependent taurine dioxygenase
MSPLAEQREKDARMRGIALSEALGIELADFDITKDCGPQEQAELRRLFIKHHLLLIRGQNPSNEEHDRFVENFGLLSLPPGDDGDAGYVSNKGNGMFGTGADQELLWHADGTYGPQPGIATSLLAKDVTPGSAPTMFANAIRALESLPPELRVRLETLSAVHVRETQVERPDQPHRKEGELANVAPGAVRSYEHPVLYQPPHLEERVLYVNRLMTSHIVGLSSTESQALMEVLFGYIYRDDNTYIHNWEPGDVIIWDNIALQHRRPRATSSAPRHLRRLSLDGWNTGHGIMEWLAAGSKRDCARLGLPL